MSKIITSPVKRFKGEVVLSDPLTFPQVFAYEDALARRRELGEDATLMKTISVFIPGILACIEEWKLDKFPTAPTAENFPATPPASVAQLIAWLVGEITRLYNEAEEIPNA